MIEKNMIIKKLVPVILESFSKFGSKNENNDILPHSLDSWVSMNQIKYNRANPFSVITKPYNQRYQK